MNNSIDSTQKIIESLKVRDTSGKMNFPQLKLTIYDKNYDKESINLTNDNVFGKQIGNKYPYFLFNINFNVNILSISNFIIKVSSKILLENILLLNTLWKQNKKNNEKIVITEENQIKPFINYILSRFRIKNNLYDFYDENLKKLVFFSQTFFEEFIKVMIKEKEFDPKKINKGETNEKTILINTIARSNIKNIAEMLIIKTPNYTISAIKYSDTNIYQINNGIISLNEQSLKDEPSLKLKTYISDYETDLKLFYTYNSNPVKTLGNFYVFIKCQINQTDVFFGDFNSYLEGKIDILQIEDEGILCEKRRKRIDTYRNRLFGGSKTKNKRGRKKRRSKRIKRTRKIKLN